MTYKEFIEQVEDIESESMLNQSIDDVNEIFKERRKNLESQIHDLKNKIDELEEKRNEEIARLYPSFYPFPDNETICEILKSGIPLKSCFRTRIENEYRLTFNLKLPRYIKKTVEEEHFRSDDEDYTIKSSFWNEYYTQEITCYIKREIEDIDNLTVDDIVEVYDRSNEVKTEYRKKYDSYYH